MNISRLDTVLKNLSVNEQKFLLRFQPSVYELLDDLSQKGFLKLKFDSKNHETYIFLKLMKTCEYPVLLHNNLADLKIENDLLLSTKVHLYQVFSEKMKLILVNLIDFDSLGLNQAYKKTLFKLLEKLKSEYPENKFIKHLESEIRNSIAHYTYFFENDILYFYKNCFDNNPKKIELKKFELMTKELNILCELFFTVWSDIFRSE